MSEQPAELRLLICDDRDDDAVLVVRHLRHSGLHVAYERADTASEVAAALRERPPDLVISDYGMPGFTAEEALQLLHASGLDVPFIVVSGLIGDESAVTLMRSGAHDFVLKSRLVRLVPAVRRELGQAHARRERRAAEEALRISEERFRLAPPVGNGQTVLVVEDDQNVRELVSLMLGRSGYRVIPAPSPQAALALALAEQSPPGFDALLTDVVMPEMSGTVLAERVWARHPDLPVLLMSGYAARGLSDGFVPVGPVSLIRKPFTTAALLTAIDQLLRTPHPRVGA